MRLGSVPSQLVAHFSYKLITRLRGPGIRLYISVIDGGIHGSKLGVPGSIISFVTRAYGNDIHSLRNTVGNLLTCDVMCGDDVSVQLTRHIVGHTIGIRRDGGILALSRVIRTIYGRCGMAITTIGDGDHGHRCIRTHRITVFVTRGLVGVPTSEINGLVNGHSRDAIVRDYTGMRRQLGVSTRFFSRLSDVRGKLEIGEWLV